MKWFHYGTWFKIVRNLISTFIFYFQLGLIFEPLLNSFNSTVSVASMEELYRSTMIWVDQHCSLVEIRPGKHRWYCCNSSISDFWPKLLSLELIIFSFLFLAVSDKLRYLSTTTDILSDPPSTLQEEVLKALSPSGAGSSTSLL